MTSLRLPISVALVALALAACTSPPQPGPSATPTAAPSTTPTSTTSAAASPASGIGELKSVELTVPDGIDPGNAEGQSLKLPAGWTAEVWANIPGARLAAFDADGRLLVSNGDGGTVTTLTPTEPGKAPEESTLLDGLNGPQGLAFALNGKLLVVGERDRVVAYDYLNGEATNPQVLVDGLQTSGHGSKGIAVDGSVVYYTLGSESNRNAGDRDTDPARASIWRVGIDGGGNAVVATGVRNGFALAIAPDKTLFAAVNQMDDQPYPYDDDNGQYGAQVPEYINENPVEQVTRITEGAELGWPLCVPDIRDNPERLNVPFVNDPINNPDGDELACSSLEPTMVGLPAHSAPLGLSFTAGTPIGGALGSGALVASHGSWNRHPPREPNVAFLPWDDATNTLGAPVPLVMGFQSDDGNRFGRSVAAVPGPDGSLYVTDDEAGLVYRITPGG